MAAGSRQAAARALRLAFLERAADRTGAAAVAVGHTADDVVEGVVLHLLRGAALPGLRGMPPRNGRTLRPLWGVWHRDVEAYLRAAGVTPLRDPSNQDAEHYARVRVRLHLLPELRSHLPEVDHRVWRVAVRAVAWTERLEQEAGECGPRLEDLVAAVPAVRHEVYRQLHGGLPALNRRHLEAVDRLVLRGATGDGLDLPAGRLWRERDHLVLERVTPIPAVLHGAPGAAGALVRGLRGSDRGGGPPAGRRHSTAGTGAAPEPRTAAAAGRREGVPEAAGSAGRRGRSPAPPRRPSAAFRGGRTGHGWPAAVGPRGGTRRRAHDAHRAPGMARQPRRKSLDREAGEQKNGMVVSSLITLRSLYL